MLPLAIPSPLLRSRLPRSRQSPADLVRFDDHELLGIEYGFIVPIDGTRDDEFWTGHRGEDGFGVERGTEMYERTKTWGRRGTWIDLRQFSFLDAGWRGPIDYSRFAIAVEQYAATVKADIFPLTLSGEVCRWSQRDAGTDRRLSEREVRVGMRCRLRVEEPLPPERSHFGDEVARPLDALPPPQQAVDRHAKLLEVDRLRCLLDPCPQHRHLAFTDLPPLGGGDARYPQQLRCDAAQLALAESDDLEQLAVRDASNLHAGRTLAVQKTLEAVGMHPHLLEAIALICVRGPDASGLALDLGSTADLAGRRHGRPANTADHETPRMSILSRFVPFGAPKRRSVRAA